MEISKLGKNEWAIGVGKKLSLVLFQEASRGKVQTSFISKCSLMCIQRIDQIIKKIRVNSHFCPSMCDSLTNTCLKDEKSATNMSCR